MPKRTVQIYGQSANIERLGAKRDCASRFAMRWPLVQTWPLDSRLLRTYGYFGCVVEHNEDERDEMEAADDLSHAFIVAHQAPDPGSPAKDRSTTKRRGRSTKPRLASRCLTTAKPHTSLMLLR